MYKYLVVLLLVVVTKGYSQPLWVTLEQMSQEERENSEIEIIIQQNASYQALQMVQNIESLWNSYRFEDALALFPKLETLTDINEMEIGNTWREPVQTYTEVLWGNDVRIGNRDSVNIVSMDIHHGSGNLFAAIQFRQGSAYTFSINISTDGGLTWSETFTATNSQPIQISALVYGNHCFLAYAYGSSANIRRFKYSDASPDTFSNGQYTIGVYNTGGSVCNEIALSSFEDGGGNRLLYFIITSYGNLNFFWADSSGIIWTDQSPGISNAARGLDACANQNHYYYLYLSYIDDYDHLRIYGREHYSGFHLLLTSSIGTYTPLQRFSSISAYEDTIACAFTFVDPPHYNRVCGFQSNDGGNNWFWFEIDDTTSMSPDITLRRGGGIGMTYMNIMTPASGGFIWGNYNESWYQNTPTPFTDHTFPAFTKPSIEYLGSGTYGIVYVGLNQLSLKCAYFDRSDFSAVNENISNNIDSHIMSITPNPSSCGISKISYFVTSHGNVSILVLDATGRVIKTLVNEVKPPGGYTITMNNDNLTSGAYLVRFETTDKIETQIMTIIQ